MISCDHCNPSYVTSAESKEKISFSLILPMTAMPNVDVLRFCPIPPRWCHRTYKCMSQCSIRLTESGHSGHTIFTSDREVVGMTRFVLPQPQLSEQHV